MRFASFRPVFLHLLTMRGAPRRRLAGGSRRGPRGLLRLDALGVASHTSPTAVSAQSFCRRDGEEEGDAAGHTAAHLRGGGGDLGGDVPRGCGARHLYGEPRHRRGGSAQGIPGGSEWIYECNSLLISSSTVLLYYCSLLYHTCRVIIIYIYIYIIINLLI